MANGREAGECVLDGLWGGSTSAFPTGGFFMGGVIFSILQGEGHILHSPQGYVLQTLIKGDVTPTALLLVL